MDERSENDIAALIERALAEGPFSIQQLATDAGISYDTLYSWAKRRRIPRGENLVELAKSFERRAEILEIIAQDLRRVANAASNE
jgi:lambda repressor-like predicted transcriptional regulator